MRKKLIMVGMMLAMVLVVAYPASAQVLGDQRFATIEQPNAMEQELLQQVNPTIAQGQGSSNASLFSGGSLFSWNEFAGLF